MPEQGIATATPAMPSPRSAKRMNDSDCQEGVFALLADPTTHGGAAVEWAVEMHRFDENATLDRLAAAGKIDAALSDALGRAVAALHARASAVEAEPWIAALADYIEQNDAAFRAMPNLFPRAEV